MSLGARPPQRPSTGRTVAGRVALVLLAGLLGVAAWLYVWPPTGEPLDEGPVVVLGGGDGERLTAARELVGEPRIGRELVLSQGASAQWELLGRTCVVEEVRCFEPEPGNTYGEALAVDRLAGERGWSQVTVVTSDYHATRTRLYFERCVAADVEVVGVDSGRSLSDRIAGTPYELLGTLAAVGNLLTC